MQCYESACLCYNQYGLNKLYQPNPTQESFHKLHWQICIYVSKDEETNNYLTISNSATSFRQLAIDRNDILAK